MAKDTKKVVGAEPTPAVEETIVTPAPVEPTPEPTPVTPATPAISPEVQALLDAIQQERDARDRQHNELLATIQSQNDDIQLLQSELNAVADKGRLSDWESKSTGKTAEKVIKVRSYSGKIVIGWTPMKSNLVYKNSQGALVEDQTTELIYEDQSREVVKYDAWSANWAPVVCVLKSSETLSTGEVIFNLEDENGKKLRIQNKFVN